MIILEAMSELTVINPGVFTTIQDDGRFGFGKYGVPVSGAMDAESYKLVNQLVSNPDHYPVLECTLQGGTYRFNSDAVIAITGAEMNPELNEQSIKMNCTHSVSKGDELSLKFAQKGCRAYIAISGLLKAEKTMGSYSTYTLAGLGGYSGRALKRNDTLKWEKASIGEVKTEAIKPVNLRDIHTVRILFGSEWEWLDNETKEHFLSHNFKVMNQSNRMGIRLEGASLKSPNRQMISSPVIPGIIQLPQNGNPIILMKDGQTIGGYPRIAKVVDHDLWKLAQLKPGDAISFRKSVADLPE